MFRGSITALITPFKDGEIDWAAFENLVEWQIEQGTHGLVPCGTTGEAPTLSDEEIRRVISTCVKITAGRIPVIAGTGSNSTAKTIAMTKMARECGADAALIVAPYYNKPSQDGLHAHYRAVHDATDLPIVLYNVPSRTVIEIAPDTVKRLAELPRIVAIKDATPDVARATLLLPQVKAGFAFLSGDDGIAGAFLAQGAVGCISVASNVAPSLCAQFQNAWAEGDRDRFAQLQTRLAPLHKALFTESSPAPIKYACSALGLCGDEVRLPLLPASSGCRERLDRVLADLDLRPAAGSATLRAVHG